MKWYAIVTGLCFYGGVLCTSATALTLTNYYDDLYYTDFDTTNMAGDFCDAALMEMQFLSYNTGGAPYTGNAAVTNLPGAMRFMVNWNNDALKALIRGGVQTSEWVQIGVDGAGDINSQAYGVFSNTYAAMTYTYYQSGGTSYTNLNVMLSARKLNSPYQYRNPSYLVVYNGMRLSIQEWTYLYTAPAREIAGTNVSISSGANTLKLVLNVQGGDDNGGDPVGASAVTLTGELWEQKNKIAEVSGLDNPFDWSSGPEIAGSTNNPDAETWTPYAGDWTKSSNWGSDSRDIHTAGWVVFGIKKVPNIGTWQGIDVTQLLVRDKAPPVLRGMVILLR